VAALSGLSFGEVSALTTVVYGLVGAGALLEARPGPVAAAGEPPCVIRSFLGSPFKECT